MNNLKFGVLACGLIGLIACFIPDHGVSFWKMHEMPTSMGGGAHIYMVLAGFIAAVVCAGLGVAKPPMQRWQGVVSLIGFAFILFKLRSLLGEMIKHGNIEGRLMAFSAIIGCVFAVLTLGKPETAR